MDESVLGRMQQETRARNSSDQAADRERDHDAPRNVEVLAIGSGTCCRSDPERDRIGGVRRDGSDSAEKQCWESDKTASAGDGVKRAAESSREKQKDYGLQVQVQDVSRPDRWA